MAADQTQRDAQFRPRLTAELADLEAISEAHAGDRAPVELDQQTVGRLSRMDAMQVQAMAEATERRRQGRIAVLKAALARMEAGEFGDCESCGEPIPEERLEVDPAVRLCVDCARRGGP